MCMWVSLSLSTPPADPVLSRAPTAEFGQGGGKWLGIRQLRGVLAFIRKGSNPVFVVLIVIIIYVIISIPCQFETH